MTDITLKTIASGYNLNKINDNFVTLEDNINNTSIQSTGGNNVMSQDFDMNSKRMINLPAPVSGSEPIRLSDAEALASQTTGGSTISETPPIINTPGDRWTRCSDMKAFLWYVDVDGGQWIEDRPSYGIDTIPNPTIPYVFDTVAAMTSSTIFFPVGKVLKTKTYYSTIGGGGNQYEVSTDSSVDAYSSFSLGGGNFAQPINEGVINSTQFGVMPDGVTNWEGTEGARMLALYAALNRGIEVKFTRVGDNTLYFTGMNIYNYYAQNWTMSFDAGVEFGNILHIISSGTAIFDRVLTTIPTGTNPTITFDVAHGMVTQRFVDFSGTGTSLDGGSFLITPAAANTAVVTATVTGTNTGTGICSDTAIKGVTLKGTYTTYDRWGLINVDGLRADRIVCKSDPSKHTTGAEGGGVHIFTMCKNFNVNEVIIEDTKNQAASANQHAAFACDGIGLENLNFEKVWVKDTKVNGVILQGEGYHIGQLIVDAYGRGVMTSVIPFVGASDLLGQTSASRAHGLWISRATGRIDHVIINQKYGFSGRGFASKDVMFDRDFLLWNSPNLDSFEDVKTGFSVGHIECVNPQYVAVDFGTYQGWCTPEVEKITLGTISDENDAVLSDSNRLERGLVNIGYTRATVGQIRCQNVKEAALLLHNATYSYGITPAMGREPSINVTTIDCEDHAASIVTLNCPHNVGSITTDKVTIKDSYYLEPSVLIGTRAVGSNIGRIVGRLESGQVNKSLLEYGAQGSTIGSIQAYNYVANRTTNNAVVHIKNAKYSSVNNVKIEANALSGTGGGIKYTGTYQFKTDTMLVDDMNQGVIDGLGNGRMIAIGCVSLTNTTASDLPAATLVGDVGNFQWTV
tara:strand:- start:163 stop:2727 length:2565 start_codon:yes stop_codon:yes gene_type:complete